MMHLEQIYEDMFDSIEKEKYPKDLLDILNNSGLFYRKINSKFNDKDLMNLRTILAGDAVPTAKQKTHLQSLSNGKEIYNGIAKSSQGMYLATQLPKIIEQFLVRYPKVLDYADISELETTEIRDKYLLKMQREKRRTIIRTITYNLTESVVVKLLKNQANFSKIWQKHFQALGLEWTDTFSQNLKTWEKHRQLHHEISLLFNLFSRETRVFNSFSLKHIDIDLENNCFVLTAEDATTVLPINLNVDFPLYSLLCAIVLERKLIRQFCEASSRKLKSKLKTDEVLTKYETQLYAPEFGQYLRSKFWSLLPYGIDKPQGNCFVLFEGNLILIYDANYRLITQTRIVIPSYQQMFVGLLQEFFHKNKQSFQRSIINTRNCTEREKGKNFLPYFEFLHKQEIEGITAELQAEQIKELESYQKKGADEIYAEILHAVSFEKTFHTLFTNSRSTEMEDFLNDHANLSPGMLAFLSMFDCKTLNAETITGINLLNQPEFNTEGMYISIIDKDGFSNNHFVPYVNKIQSMIFSINLKEISIKQYLTALYKKLANRLFSTAVTKRSKIPKTLFYSMNEKRYLDDGETLNFLANLNTEIPKDWLKTNEIILMAFNLQKVVFYKDNFVQLGEMSYKKEFTDIILSLQTPTAVQILNGISSVNLWLRHWLLNKKLKNLLLEGFYQTDIFTQTASAITQINQMLKQKAYPFKILDSDDLFVHEQKITNSTKLLGAKEAGEIIKIMMLWFPKGTFRANNQFKGVKYVAKAQVGYNDFSQRKNPSIDWSNTRWFRSYKQIILERLRKSNSDTGISYLDYLEFLRFDEVYFLGLEDKKDLTTVKAILKNLILWLLQQRARELKYGGNQEGKKIFIEQMMKYINVRLGRIDIKDIDDKLKKRFELFDSVFLDGDELPTIPKQYRQKIA